MKPDQLKDIPLFGGLDEDELEFLASVCTEQSLKPNAVLFAEGDDPDGLYVVLSGRIGIEHQSPFAEGALSTFVLQAGDFFGEMALFDEGPRSAGARSLESTQLLRIDQNTFRSLITERASAAGKLITPLLQAIVPRMRQTNRQLLALFEAGRAIGDIHQLPQLLERLLHIIIEASRADAGLIYLYNEITEQLEPHTLVGLSAADVESVPPDPPHTLPAMIYAQPTPLAIERLTDDPRCASVQALPHEAHSLLVVPLASGSTTFGVIELVATDRVFSAHDLSVSYCVALQVGQAIQSVRLLEAEMGRERLDQQRFTF